MRVGIIQNVLRCVHRGCSRAITRNGPQMALISSLQPRRHYADTPEPYKFINVKQTDQKGAVILELNRKPVNGLNLDFLTEINIALEKLENDKTCRGVIITSALPVFCAGLDFTELYQPQEDRLKAFWRSFQDMALRIYGSPLATVAAISGPCPAGGCAVAFSSDYRVLADGKHLMGLNEAQIGIVAPYWLQQLAQYTMGIRNADHMLQLGSLLSPQRALQQGAVDEVVAPDQVLEVAMNNLKQALAIPDIGRQMTKQMLHQGFLTELNRRREEDLAAFTGIVLKDSIQKLIGAYLESLSKRAK